jgi:hypothetical protein
MGAADRHGVALDLAEEVAAGRLSRAEAAVRLAMATAVDQEAAAGELEELVRGIALVREHGAAASHIPATQPADSGAVVGRVDRGPVGRRRSSTVGAGLAMAAVVVVLVVAVLSRGSPPGPAASASPGASPSVGPSASPVASGATATPATPSSLHPTTPPTVGPGASVDPTTGLPLLPVNVALDGDPSLILGRIGGEGELAAFRWTPGSDPVRLHELEIPGTVPAGRPQLFAAPGGRGYVIRMVQEPAGSQPDLVWVFDADGTFVWSPPPTEPLSPLTSMAWAPDGSTVAFDTFAGTWVVVGVGRDPGQTRVIDTTRPDDGGIQLQPYLLIGYSADGRTLYGAIGIGTPSSVRAAVAVDVANGSTRAIERLPTDAAGRLATSNTRGTPNDAFDPLTGRLAEAAYVNGVGTVTVWSPDHARTEDIELEGAANVTFSNDGRLVLMRLLDAVPADGAPKPPWSIVLSEIPLDAFPVPVDAIRDVPGRIGPAGFGALLIGVRDGVAIVGIDSLSVRVSTLVLVDLETGAVSVAPDSVPVYSLAGWWSDGTG